MAVGPEARVGEEGRLLYGEVEGGRRREFGLGGRTLKASERGNGCRRRRSRERSSTSALGASVDASDSSAFASDGGVGVCSSDGDWHVRSGKRASLTEERRRGEHRHRECRHCQQGGQGGSEGEERSGGEGGGKDGGKYRQEGPRHRNRVDGAAVAVSRDGSVGSCDAARGKRVISLCGGRDVHEQSSQVRRGWELLATNLSRYAGREGQAGGAESDARARDVARDRHEVRFNLRPFVGGRCSLLRSKAFPSLDSYHSTTTASAAPSRASPPPSPSRPLPSQPNSHPRKQARVLSPSSFTKSWPGRASLGDGTLPSSTDLEASLSSRR